MDLFEPGYVAECDVALQQRQVGAASRFAQRSALVVRGAVIPSSKALADGSGKRAWRVVLVH